MLLTTTTRHAKKKKRFISKREIWSFLKERNVKMKARKRPVVVDFITFDDFVEYGKAHCFNLVNGMPWSFEYNGHSVTHENDNCYLVPTKEGIMQFNRQSVLITGVAGEIYPCELTIFARTYDVIGE
jgi:hypothetical protein